MTRRILINILYKINKEIKIQIRNTLFDSTREHARLKKKKKNHFLGQGQKSYLFVTNTLTNNLKYKNNFYSYQMHP
jgi:hypothetical protein